MLTISEIMSYEFKNETEMTVFFDILKLPQPIFCMLLEELISGNISYTMFTASKLNLLVSPKHNLEKNINYEIEKSESINNQTFDKNILENSIFPRLRGDSVNFKILDLRLDELRRLILDNADNLKSLSDEDMLNYENEEMLVSYSGDSTKISLSASEIAYIESNGINKNRYLKNKQLQMLHMNNRRN